MESINERYSHFYRGQIHIVLKIASIKLKIVNKSILFDQEKWRTLKPLCIICLSFFQLPLRAQGVRIRQLTNKVLALKPRQTQQQ